MEKIIKYTEELDGDDLDKYPVWEYVDPFDHENRKVTPVRKLPVKSLRFRLVGIQVRFNNQSKHWAILTHIHPDDLIRTQQFIRAWIQNDDGEWFELAQYHDIGFEKHGPKQLAEFMGLEIEDVYPISYDISKIVDGKREVVAGVIWAEPVERLTDSELSRLALSE